MITYIIIASTVITSLYAFKNHSIFDKFIFHPPAVNRGEWYRLFTYGLLHADTTHLIFNMFTLYFFGPEIEKNCKIALGMQTGSLMYVLLYITSLPISIFPTYLKNKNNATYHSLGASGAVSAIIFAYILINPMSFMGILFIPIWLPAFIFGILFVVISVYLDKKQSGRINHSAHMAGGVYGIVFITIAFLVLANINLVEAFISQINITGINDLFRFGF